MTSVYQKRRLMTVFVSLIFFGYIIFTNTPISQPISRPEVKSLTTEVGNNLAIDGLNSLVIKGRAPKTDYSRDKFGADWRKTNGCDMRNIILNRDLSNVVVNEKCEVESGVLSDPYAGKTIDFIRGTETSGDVQIDHVVALSDAWQKGAQQLTDERRFELANDPLELLAVDGTANQKKSDGDAATWLPSDKSFRCQYVARQVAVKIKYELWITEAEYDAIAAVLDKCPGQLLPNP